MAHRLRRLRQGLPSLRQALPTLITAGGHLLTLAWLCGGAWWVGGLGLLCDGLDGRVARHLGACTAFGSLYDWLLDCTTAALIAARYSPWLLFILVPLQVAMRQRDVHFSGRTVLTVIVIAGQLR